MDSGDKVRTWVAVAGLAISVLAFLGVTNLKQIGEAISPSAKPTHQAGPALPAFTESVVTPKVQAPAVSETPSASKSPTPDPGCEAANSTIDAYDGLITMDNQEAAAASFNRRASALEADAKTATTAKVRAAINAMAVASRAEADALPTRTQADSDRYKAARERVNRA
ncbi:hypothetical protein, partial [Kitasatospora nipponensis]